MKRPIFLSVSPGEKTAQIKSSLFICQETNRPVIGNSVAVPLSPFSGKAMQRATKQTVVASGSKIQSELTDLGKCTACPKHLFANADGYKMVKASKRAHCIYCGEPIKLKAATSPIIPEAFEDHDLDMGDDLHHDPRVLHGDDEFEDVGLNHILLASDDDNDGDDQDNDEEDDDDYNDDDLGDVSDDDDDGYNSDDEDDSDDDYPDDDDDDDGDYDDDPDDEDDTDAEDTTDDDGEDGDGNEDDDQPDDDDDQGDDDQSDDDDDDDDSDEDGQNVQASARGFGRRNVMATLGDSADSAILPDDDSGEDSSDSLDSDTSNNVVSAGYLEINATDALFESLSGNNTQMGVVVLDPSCAMLVAHVQDVGYMPVVAFDRSKADPDLQTLFDNGDKLSSAINTVIANADTFQPKLLSKFGVRELKYGVQSSKFIENRIKAGVEAITASSKEERESFIDDMRQCLSIASVQVLKNLKTDTPNVVASHLAEQLSKIGVHAADSIVSEAFMTKGPELMASVLSSALDLYVKPISTRNEIANYVTTAAAVNSPSFVSRGTRVAKTLADGNVPVSVTASGHDVEAAGEPTRSTVVDYSRLVNAAARRAANR